MTNKTDALDKPLTRRDAIRLMGAAAAGLAGLPYSVDGAEAPKASEPKAERPNILFILSDNIQSDDMGLTGHPFIQTPGLDKLASEGVVFENAFCTTPLCSPARASVLTGAYAHNHGVRNNHTPWTGRKTTFLELMKNAGYDTAFIGKWHMPGKGLPDMPFLDLFVSYTYREGQGSYFNCPLIVNGKETPSRKPYLSEELTDRTIEFIEERAQSGDASKPFCIYLSHRASHPPFVPPEDIRGMYDDVDVNLPEDVDSWFSKTGGNVFQGIMMGSYENQYRKYCEVITAMDGQIQRLMNRIDELGLDKNTIIIYAADNGMMWGEHRSHGIRRPYEESIRTPFIVRAPTLVGNPGTRREQMILNIDIAPTIRNLAGAAIPDDMDGESFAPFLGSADAPGREAFLIEFWKYYPENTPTYFGVRTQTHKYIEYEKTLKPLLFDLEVDPGEQNNLYGTPEGETLAGDLKALLNTLKHNGNAR